MSEDAALDRVDALAPLAFYVRDYHSSHPQGERFRAITQRIGAYAFALQRDRRVRPQRSDADDDAAVQWALALYDETSSTQEPGRRRAMRAAMIDVFLWYGISPESLDPANEVHDDEPDRNATPA